MTDPNLVTILERMQQNHKALIERIQQNHKALIEGINGVRESLNPNENCQQHDKPTLNSNNPSSPPTQMPTIIIKERQEQPNEVENRLVTNEETTFVI